MKASLTNLKYSLFSFCVQRGRDHGLAGYTKYKEYCEGLKWSARDLSDLEKNNLMSREHVNTLKKCKIFSSLLNMKI